MSDPIRHEWQQRFEEKLQEREHLLDVSTEREHGDFVMNKTRAPLIISGLGQDIIDDNNRRIKNTILIKVAGEDEFGGGFHDIRQYTDQELDKCTGYQDFLKKGWLQEISEEDYYAYRSRIETHLENMRTNPDYYWKVRMQDLRSQQMFIAPVRFERQVEPITTYDLKTNKEILNSEEDYRAAGFNGRFDTMSSFHKMSF